eukprot:7464911-Karenia_brevis.AAC.1
MYAIVRNSGLYYQLLDYPGTKCSQEHLSGVEPTPPLGAPGRGSHKHFVPPCGPIGHLLQHAHHFAIALDLHTNTLHRHGLPALNYMTLPLQCFKSLVLKMGFDATHFAVAKTRTVLNDMPRFDPDIFAAALPTDDEHVCNVVKSVASFSTVDQSLLHRFDKQQSDMCPFCQQCTSSIHHVI